ncbi:helix-turn-helix transcriptional regulator [Actinoplanes sp. LDG1-06]|uniref:Helix-turn-helix transcriptional regulator n=1 Tax=Paractinoplanes ovalisporus TaxID=2810368 RepID=A0ABS2A935_9ACTN|nr:helix-turn-helix transcriptional regulator [Actinoplanes ovalisporus]MBM2616349.1 helix-turn-helix transcriptional regulator [Actinoplanes ovalisporus]
MSVPPSLGEIIRRRRELAELPIRQFAAMVGISGPYLSQIERGLRAPSDRVLRAIAGSLRTTADALRIEAGPEWDAPPPVLTAIAADPRLTARQRQALTEVYLAFVATGNE